MSRAIASLLAIGALPLTLSMPARAPIAVDPELATTPTGLSLSAFASATADCTSPDATAPTRTVRLTRTFAEPFDMLDMARWTPHYDGGYDWPSKRTLSANGEQQLYVDKGYKANAPQPLGLDPFRIRDGVLSIVGAPAPTRALPFLYGRRYVSGMLTTRRSLVQIYGYFEFRAKIPVGQGVWPAFWLIPADKSWPPEIDVLEVRGRDPENMLMTVHWKVGGGPALGHSGCTQRLPRANTQFHNFGVLWEPEQITYYIDRRPIGALRRPEGVDKPMYMIVNLALGGRFGGDVDATTKLPVSLDVDHVTAYRLADAR